MSRRTTSRTILATHALFPRHYMSSRPYNRQKGVAKITYNAPMVNEIAKPIFLDLETWSFQIIGIGNNRTVTTVAALVSPHMK